MSDLPQLSPEERLAALEEKTRDKPKTTLERVKEWSGFATVVIALLYSFPLGIWDYWVTTPQARELEALRTATTQLAELEARQTQGFAAITTPELRVTFVQAMTAQRAAVLARVQPLIEKRQGDLTMPELIMLGYNLAQYGLPDRALATYATALSVAERDRVPLALHADIYRMTALVHANLPSAPEVGTIRRNYARNIQLLMASPGPMSVPQAVHSAFEWAFVEKMLQSGNWSCGEALQLWASETIAPMAAMNANIPVMVQAHTARLAALPPPRGEARRPCPYTMADAVRGAMP